MNPSFETIASEAMLLPKDKRLVLAHRILSSLEPFPDAEVEKAWDTEIRRRIRAYDAGSEVGIPASAVFAELDKKLKR